MGRAPTASGTGEERFESSTSMNGVAFSGVRYGLPGHPPMVTNLSFSVHAGETLALVGASGAGKTTVLKLVNRLLLPETGDVRVQGKGTRDWDPIRLRRSVGYVIQEVGLFPHMTVADNIALVPRLEGWDADRTASRVQELLGLMGLVPDIHALRWPHELSGGQRQRVGVARALAADPPVLLMDEPFGALDAVTRRDLQQEFRRIQAQVAKCVILVTHDMTEALTLGDRVGVMDRGRLIWIGPPSAIEASDDERVRTLVEAARPLPRSISGPPA